ncbi:MAG: GNAT family N-acetyltransferase [Eubacteriales bacterium]|nr:GNAT family N-acetyltransferase [Eubacteriales bacterium]
MHYVVDDRALRAEDFLALANCVWPGDYDAAKTCQALQKTLNIAAYQDGRLIGCLRILSDGYFFGTITELLVLPAFQRKGIGSHLLKLAKAHTPTLLYFGAQQDAEGFYEKNGCQRGMQSYIIPKAGR